MIRDYKTETVLDTPTDTCTLYKCSRQGKTFLVHEFEDLNDSDEFTFKIVKKLAKLGSHVVQIADEFEDKGNKYFVTEYVEHDLLKLMLSQPQRVLDLLAAMHYFSKIIEIVSLLHLHKLVYRNVRAEVIKVRGDNSVALFDFSMSQFTKRQERLFEVVGCVSFLAPQFYSEDGYGAEVDIWSCGVVLFHMLTSEYPFRFKSNDEPSIKEEFASKCSLPEGFSFSKALEHTKHNSAPLKGNKHLEDLFKRLFTLNPHYRITIAEMKRHRLLEEFFKGEEQTVDKEMLEAISEGGREESLLLSRFEKHSFSEDLYREEVILDFIEHSAESFVLYCSEIYKEELQYRVQFAILKAGLIKCNFLIDVLYGKREPAFKVSPEEWGRMRGSSSLVQLKEKLERKTKIILMLYKNALMHVQAEESETGRLFVEDIPESFDQIKIAYRNTLSEMFEEGRKNLVKTKANRKLSRELTENLVRVIIFFLINRLFQTEEGMREDFRLYYEWSKKKDLSELQEWIASENIANLKSFMKSVTGRYL